MPGPGDRGVEQFTGQQPGVLGRQQHGDLGGLAALALVDGHGVHGLDVGEPAGGELHRPTRTGHHRPQDAVAQHRHPGVAVVEPQPVVICGHQDRSADVPLGPQRHVGLLGQPAFDLPVPVGDPEWPAAVRAQHPVFFQRGDRRGCVSEHRRLPQPQRLRHKDCPQRRGGIVGVHPLHMLPTGGEDVDGGVGVAVSDRARQGTDGRPESV